MVNKTPNHGLNKWEEGDTNWTHSPDMQTIEERLVIRDKESALGNYSPHTGATFVAVDTGAVYDGDGSSWNAAVREVDSATAKSVTVEDSFTWPDGSTTTTSPSGVGRNVYRNVPSGIVYKDSSGDVVAESFVTDESWSDGKDTGTVLQSLIDSIQEAKNTDQNIGEIQFGTGGFVFETPVVFNKHRGTKLVGQSFRQSDGQGGTRLYGGQISSGRGLLEFGNIGSTTSPGNGEACHIKGFHIDLNGADAAGVYVWGQDRVRLSDVKIDDPGRYGNGAVYIGSFNSTWTDCYVEQAAVVRNLALSKDTNSMRLHNFTFTTANASVPPLLMFGQGWRATHGVVNGVDGPGPNDDVTTISDDASNDLAILNSDSRVDSADVSAQINRTQWSSVRFNSGGSSVTIFPSSYRNTFASCAFSASERVFDTLSATSISGCEFVGAGKEAIRRKSGGGMTSTIVGCQFRDYGQSSGEAAIRFEGSHNHLTVVSGNAFRAGNGNTDDIVLENNANCIVVTGNWCSNGISATLGASNKGSPRETVSKVVSNSINPIGFTRTSPGLPGGTGSGNAVFNGNAQGAWVYHDGGGININSFGNTHTYSTDQSPVYVPRAGEIWFDNSVPSAWDWWWV